MVVEVRVRMPDERKLWEDREVYTTFEVVGDPKTHKWMVDLKGGYQVTLSEAVEQIGVAAGAVETRWNFQGSFQGHYTLMPG
jgi:hypothetical protein